MLVPNQLKLSADLIRNKRKKVSVACPKIVKDYNVHMGGVNLWTVIWAATKFESKAENGIFDYFIT